MNNTKTSQHSLIRIFVSAHKPAAFPDCACIVPVQVGANNASTLFDNTLHDNEGDNISSKNPMYCELTTQYWAWKNSKADYYGFCHYRRYFDFSPDNHPQNNCGEIMETFIDQNALKRYSLNDEAIAHAVEGWDIITTPINNVKSIDGSHSLKEHWCKNPHLRIEDLHRMYDILCIMQPKYEEDATTVLNGCEAAFCNMFIMKRELFFEYCDWLFPLLDKFVETTDFTNVDQETLRTPGHLAERLLNIWIAHQERVKRGLQIHQLQCIHFSDSEPTQHIEPLDINPRIVVPVVFAADNNYVPMLTTSIYSMLKNADPSRHYDVIVLERDITDENKQLILGFLKTFTNADVRFVDVSHAIDGFDLTTSNSHISIETYYRFIIQEALPFYNKIVYLDSDLVITDDVSELYDTDLENNALGAVRDVDFLGNLNFADGSRMRYATAKLHMEHPFDYFQAGVLVMNLNRLRELHSVDEWLRLASDPAYIYNDQDILNQECEGLVHFLPYEWNVMHNCVNRVNTVFNFAPANVYKAYLASRKIPKIVHYAGVDKPWRNPWCDFGALYWQYAQKTPFSLQMIALLAGVERPKPSVVHNRVIAEDSPIRKYVDKIAPYGSTQREALKYMARKLKHKS